MNIMLILENVTKKNNIIEADYGRSLKENRGHVVYDINKGDFINIVYSESDSDEVKYGFGHLLRLFRDMVKANNYPSNFSYFWY